MDRRTRYTRMVIKEALLDFLEKKSLSEITVKEICQVAEINRATFYRHYLDIYDLFEQMEQELTETAFSSGDLTQDRYQLLHIIYENQVFYKEFFRSRLESRFIKQTLERIYQEMKEGLQVTDERVFQITFQYNYHGALGVIKDWLEAGCLESPKELGDILFAIVEKQYRF